MARNDGRIEPGQKLSSAISAKAWNRAQLAADVVLGVGTGINADSPQYQSSPYVAVYARNATGSAVARWGVMAITGVEITPTSSAGGATAQFEQMPVLTGGTPSATADAWCVAVQPLTDNAIGRVAVSGVVQIKTSSLDQAKGALVVWKNDEWALIRIGGGDPLRLCKTSSDFNKGSVATLEVWEDGTPPSETCSAGKTVVDVVNKYADIASGKFCSVARHGNGRWYVVAAECQ